MTLKSFLFILFSYKILTYVPFDNHNKGMTSEASTSSYRQGRLTDNRADWEATFRHHAEIERASKLERKARKRREEKAKQQSISGDVSNRDWLQGISEVPNTNNKSSGRTVTGFPIKITNTRDSWWPLDPRFTDRRRLCWGKQQFQRYSIYPGAPTKEKDSQLILLYDEYHAPAANAPMVAITTKSRAEISQVTIDENIPIRYFITQLVVADEDKKIICNEYFRDA